MQVVQLDSKIKLLDCPGIVFAKAGAQSDNSSALKNAVRVESLADPIAPATAILQRANKEQMMELYDLPVYSTPEEFFSLRARRMGHIKKSGVPNIASAARGLIEDWNRGKIKYYTVPPENRDSEVHVSAAIVQQVAAEFDIAACETMETEVLGSLSPAEKSLMGKKEERDKKMETQMALEGNQKLNLHNKMAFKKQKKDQARKGKHAANQISAWTRPEGSTNLTCLSTVSERVAVSLSTALETVTLDTNTDDYDFKSDFTWVVLADSRRDKLGDVWVVLADSRRDKLGDVWVCGSHRQLHGDTITERQFSPH
uniref:Guanine nucleotide-binding protein-like 3 homolog n=1 Tax=Timema poppense TaxID=170557 RepID=A0A7R9DMH6_TIMPO|nr:unnamed protein product [Timema poppensis]